MGRLFRTLRSGPLGSDVAVTIRQGGRRATTAALAATTSITVLSLRWFLSPLCCAHPASFADKQRVRHTLHVRGRRSLHVCTPRLYSTYIQRVCTKRNVTPRHFSAFFSLYKEIDTPTRAFCFSFFSGWYREVMLKKNVCVLLQTTIHAYVTTCRVQEYCIQHKIDIILPPLSPILPHRTSYPVHRTPEPHVTAKYINIVPELTTDTCRIESRNRLHVDS